MDAGVQLKYGFIRGNELSHNGKLAASQTMRQASGRFVYLDSGQYKLNVDGSTRINGFADYVGDDASSANDPVKVNISLDAVYRIPINSGTFVVGMIGDTCDLSISSNIQGAQLDASVEDTLIIVDGDTENSEWVDVRMNPSKIGTGVGADA